ncbi:MAG: glycosyltransferase [Ktedonobacterales bacterium]
MRVPVSTDVRAMRNASTLKTAGMDVSIVDTVDKRPYTPDERLAGVTVNHVFIPFLFKRARFKPWFLARYSWFVLRGAIQLARMPADIYHACDLKALPASYLAARLRRKPLVFETYELPLQDPEFTRWRWLHTLASKVLTGMTASCAGIITTSPLHSEAMKTHYRGNNVVLVRNIPAYETPKASGRLRQHLRLPESTRIALYQGNLQAGRGLDSLVRAAKFLPTDLVVVIKGEGELLAELEALISAEGVSDRVRLVPNVPLAEMLDWTASADIGLIVHPPSFSRNVQTLLPNKLFEYLMAGLPVLATPLPAVVDIIERYDVGRVLTSLESEALGHAIGHMLSDRAALVRMHRNALAAAERELRWDVEQKNLLHLYEDVLSSQQQVLAVADEGAHAWISD